MKADAARVKELRERTGAGIMDCKRALVEAKGDGERALALLREKGLAGAAKKAGRVTADGLIGVFATDDLRTAVLLELNCETDFVAKTDEFKEIIGKVGAGLLAAGELTEGDGKTVASLVLPGDGSVSDLIAGGIASVGENLGLRRFVRLGADGGALGSYVHAGGKIGVLVEVAGADKEDVELLRSLAMQVAAAMPRYIRREEVGEEDLEREREIYAAQARTSGKPEKIIDRIVDGKLEKFYREVCLLEQPHVRDPDISVGELLERASHDKGSALAVSRFARFQLGEGIERKRSNLAEEVAEQLAQGS